MYSSTLISHDIKTTDQMINTDCGGLHLALWAVSEQEFAWQHKSKSEKKKWQDPFTVWKKLTVYFLDKKNSDLPYFGAYKEAQQWPQIIFQFSAQLSWMRINLFNILTL